MIEENSGSGKKFPEGNFYFKIIPAFVTSIKKGSIIFKILKHVFECLNKLKIYPCTPELIPPTLFNAHDSPLQVPFPCYINNLPHTLPFYISIPNDTHRWYMGDSEEHNG